MGRWIPTLSDITQRIDTRFICTNWRHLLIPCLRPSNSWFAFALYTMLLNFNSFNSFGPTQIFHPSVVLVTPPVPGLFMGINWGDLIQLRKGNKHRYYVILGTKSGWPILAKVWWRSYRHSLTKAHRRVDESGKYQNYYSAINKGVKTPCFVALERALLPNIRKSPLNYVITASKPLLWRTIVITI